MKVEDALAAAQTITDYVGIPKCHRISPPLRLIHTMSRVKVKADAVNRETHKLHIMFHDIWASINSYEIDKEPPREEIWR